MSISFAHNLCGTRLTALPSGNGTFPERVYSVVSIENSADDFYICGYCGDGLHFGTQETLRHVDRHLGESAYLAQFHQLLERRGYDELNAHLATIDVARKLTALRARRR